MGVTKEKVERLMNSADVGYDTARDALEAVDGDMIEAVMALERDGKLGPNAGKNRAAAYATGGGPATVGQFFGSSSMLPQTRVGPNFTMGGDAAPGESAGADNGAGNADKKGRKGTDSSQDAGDGPWQDGAYGQGSGMYDQPGGTYGQPGGTYGQPGGTYGQSSGQYGQPGGSYGQGNGPYGQPGGSYGQSRGQYGGNRKQGHGAYGQPGGPHRYKDETTAFEDNVKRFFSWLGRVLRAAVINYFEVWRKGERIMAFPVILFLFCIIHWVFWVVLALIVVGLFCGFRYSFSGPHLGRKSVNDAMDKVSDIAEDIKSGDQKPGEDGSGKGPGENQ